MDSHNVNRFKFTY